MSDRGDAVASPRKPRDYAAEYARRVARGRARGLTASQSAGQGKRYAAAKRRATEATGEQQPTPTPTPTRFAGGWISELPGIQADRWDVTIVSLPRDGALGFVLADEDGQTITLVGKGGIRVESFLSICPPTNRRASPYSTLGISVKQGIEALMARTGSPIPNRPTNEYWVTMTYYR